MKKNIFTSIIMAAFVGLATFFMPLDTNAQGIVLRNQNRLSKAQVGRIITKLETSSNVFRRDFDRAMDRSNLNGTNLEDRYNANVRDYEDSLDRLRTEFNRNNSWWTTRDDVSNVVNRAQVVNTMMNTISFRRTLENRWNTMRKDINTLADTYDLPGLNGGGWTGGGWDGGNVGGGGNVPSWAVGTFYARNPESGGSIQMTVQRNGRVTLVFDNGAPIPATMNGTILNNPPYQSRVSRINNGIRTTDSASNQYIDYYRTPVAPGPGPGIGGGGNVPSWAIGTFYARNPQNGGTIQMTVQRNGNVTLVFDNGPPIPATMNGTTLNNPPYQSRVSRINNNGIRTTDSATNQYIDYYRR